MSVLIEYGKRLNGLLEGLRSGDFIALFLLRVFLAPVMIAAGLTKALGFESTVMWFGNPEWGLGLPFPTLMAFLATSAELLGGILLLAGLATRFAAFALMVVMLVAAITVHWENGWFAIAPADPQTSTARPLAAVGIPAARRSLEQSEEVGQRVDVARNLLRRHGHYAWLTEKGNFVVLQNGIEFAATYFIMLMVLFFHGAGRFTSVDYWIRRWVDNDRRGLRLSL